MEIIYSKTGIMSVEGESTDENECLPCGKICG